MLVQMMVKPLRDYHVTSHNKDNKCNARQKVIKIQDDRTAHNINLNSRNLIHSFSQVVQHEISQDHCVEIDRSR